VKQNPFDLPEVASTYERWYEEAGKRADSQEKSLLLKLLTEFPGSTSILEVGCGTGHFTRWFHELGYWSAGVDKSEAMLSKAAQFGEVPYVLADAAMLPFEDDSVDIVSFVTSLEFMEEIISALAEGLRVAKRGLLLGILNKSSHLGIWRRLQSRLTESPYASARFFTIREIEAIVADLMAPERPEVIWRSTLFPIVGGNAKLPWGGFLGVAIKKPTKIEGGSK